MTFSICVRERYADDEGEVQTRYGVAVTTRLAGVGALCPFANEHGAVATQSLVNVELGERGVAYLADGLGVEDALEALLNADDGRANRQVHGVGRDGEFAFSGAECKPWFGHRVGANYTVAGNLLTGEAVVDAVAEAYEASAPSRGAKESSGERSDPRDVAETPEDPGNDPEEPLAARLITALAAGQAEGGDKREDLTVQSAALKVTTTEDREMTPYHDDLRVDASKTPVADLKEAYDLATESFEAALARYEEAYEEDDIEAADG